MCFKLFFSQEWRKQQFIKRADTTDRQRQLQSDPGTLPSALPRRGDPSSKIWKSFPVSPFPELGTGPEFCPRNESDVESSTLAEFSRAEYEGALADLIFHEISSISLN